MTQRKKKAARKKTKTQKKVTRYTYDQIKKPRTPGTGHTGLLSGDEQVVALPMNNGWSRAIEAATLPEDDERPVPDEEFRLRVESDPFPAGRFKRIAVKLVDVYASESTVVRGLT